MYMVIKQEECRVCQGRGTIDYWVGEMYEEITCSRCGGSGLYSSQVSLKKAIEDLENEAIEESIK